MSRKSIPRKLAASTGAARALPAPRTRIMSDSRAARPGFTRSSGIRSDHPMVSAARESSAQLPFDALSGRYVANGPGDAQAQLGRHVVPALPGDEDAQLGVEVERGGAGRAMLQVAGDEETLRFGQLSVQIVVDLVDRFAAVQCEPLGDAQWAGPVPVARPFSTANSHNRFWSCFLPRCSRLITVPMGISRMSAISL